MKQDFNTVRNQDCIAGLKQLPDGVVDLAFADPPFNIGYDYDVYHDKLESEDYLAWSREWMAEVVRRAQAQRHVLAGHRRRVCRRAQGDAAARAGPDLPQLGHLVLHVRRELQSQVQPLARAPVSHGQRSRRLHVQRRRDPRAVGPATGLWRRRANPNGRLPDDTWILRPQDMPEGFTSRRRHLVLSARLRHVQGAGRLARLPDARATAGADHQGVQQRRANWCSIRSPAAARRWPWPRNSSGSSWASSCRREYAARIKPGWRRSRPAIRWTARPSPWSARRTRPTAASWTTSKTACRKCDARRSHGDLTLATDRDNQPTRIDNHEIRHLQRDLSGLAVRPGLRLRGRVRLHGHRDRAVHHGRRRHAKSPPAQRERGPPAGRGQRAWKSSACTGCWPRPSGYYLTTPDADGPPRARPTTSTSWPGCAATWADRRMVFGSPQQRNLLPGVTPEQAMNYAAEVVIESLCPCWKRPA